MARVHPRLGDERYRGGTDPLATRIPDGFTEPGARLSNLLSDSPKEILGHEAISGDAEFKISAKRPVHSRIGPRTPVDRDPACSSSRRFQYPAFF